MINICRRFSRIVRSAPTISNSMPKPRYHTTNSHHADTISDCDVGQFYKYTSGRWLWNEKHQLARRYVEFDLPGLLEVSAQAIGARSCVKVEKLPEGNFNKVFLITMDDGRDLIAKLPNPNAGRPHFTTASEAATMDYVHAPQPTTSDDVDSKLPCRFKMSSVFRHPDYMAGPLQQTIRPKQSTS